MGVMESRRAEQLARAARGLGAWEAHASGGRVHIHFAGQSRDQRELGEVRLEVCDHRVRIRDYWHTSCRLGTLWSRRVAGQVQEIDALAAANLLGWPMPVDYDAVRADLAAWLVATPLTSVDANSVRDYVNPGVVRAFAMTDPEEPCTTRIEWDPRVPIVRFRPEDAKAPCGAQFHADLAATSAKFFEFGGPAHTPRLDRPGGSRYLSRRMRPPAPGSAEPWPAYSSSVLLPMGLWLPFCCGFRCLNSSCGWG